MPQGPALQVDRLFAREQVLLLTHFVEWEREWEWVRVPVQERVQALDWNMDQLTLTLRVD